MRTILLLSIFLGMSSIGFAQNQSIMDSVQIVAILNAADTNDSTIHPVKLDWNYVKSYWYDTKAVVTRPFSWNEKNITQFALISWVAGASYLLADQKIKNWSQENVTHFTNTASEIVDPLGNGRYLWITSGLVFLHGQVFKNQKSTRVGLLILESQLINGVLGQIVKLSAGRKRPWDGATAHDWAGPQYPPYHSFPSGHAQTAFALATVVAMEFKHIRAVPIIAYSLATLTVVSRINANAHWTSDLIVGAALGHFISKTIVRQHPESGDEHRKKLGWQLLPTGTGFTLAKSF
ncbi:phosphatase PAP2 family protein [Xanthocytophaga flava]|uniref:phosphatase PAP2 family protein n=1 Tax=Xanthocytophaga flava TaxID=3048013 RepID=UPI0028D8A075|nr:phosphatase PAP2 family protein [Xanthocytophaga flavus]MDJ1467434.1 phosphatase PAP2 family protein [Xanthocytophaga flavus]